MTLTILPGPAISTNFSCQLSRTLIDWPPPSPPPLEWICEKPVVCGVNGLVDALEDCDVWDMPLYLMGPSAAALRVTGTIVAKSQ